MRTHSTALRLVQLMVVPHLMCLLAATEVYADPLLTHPLTIKGHTLRAEVASTDAERRRGLMFRQALSEDQGMIFIYVRKGAHSMWMKNTAIPLSVAFIDPHGKILNIADMLPFTEQAHAAAGDALYALEMSQGWFRRHGIQRGDKVSGLNRLPKAE